MKANGFTLIELLIASVIMTAVVVLGTTAYSLFANNWQSTSDKYFQRFETSRSLNLLSQIVDSVKPVGKTVENGGVVFLFSGTASSMAGGLTKGLFSDEPVIFNLEARQVGQQTELVYKETSHIADTFMAESTDVRMGHEIVLLRDIENIEFRYFGWPHRDQKLLEVQSLNSGPNWSSEFNGIERGITPEQIEMTLRLRPDKQFVHHAFLRVSVEEMLGGEE